MSEDDETRQRDAQAGRRLQREDRRARVGILPNPCAAPPPPPRKVALMGRWPSLRSSRRRPAGAPDPDAREGAGRDPAAMVPRSARNCARTAARSLPAGTVAGIVQQGPDGSIRVDLERLDAAIRDLDAPPPRRSPHGARFRADLGDAPAPRRPAADPRPPRAAPDPQPAAAAPEPAPAPRPPGAAIEPVPEAPAQPEAARRSRPTRALLLAGLAFAIGLAVMALSR